MNNSRLQQKYVKLSIMLTYYTKHIIHLNKKSKLIMNNCVFVIHAEDSVSFCFRFSGCGFGLGFGCDLIDQCCESVASALQSAESAGLE